MGKLARQRCPGCQKPIGRHDTRRYEEPRGNINAPRIVWHLGCFQERRRKND